MNSELAKKIESAIYHTEGMGSIFCNVSAFNVDRIRQSWLDIIDFFINKSKELDNKENYKEQECLHRQCTKCNGTGRANGKICVHMISCPCPRCTIMC